ncbi:hypothetical protein A2276_03915 [candidate division WOR-1 bacterium RIFOXYA12_FULL_43_27]|uniref:Beta-lactamase class A catalytic domain-containing protein n=1 Tax=candidate division WOR-1 bacterium RIFOXYC2_FULL_46_14 TaxID=1802587 RepID=A0A1F4U764_UNCSA|nr:MAG: hypothetical protein A2276_03915 [candidate division WOR-1 bacterium RIFOXYA12_FULL_43_27]OGC19160.1 MAG: hypothetical protein A2292_00420 [candidate division WOR-1 bacterium RIFOXYB2_FULL_46_45]OGC30149.1 MAG: hypothetical protein A2232_00420 [candidate division WOR-1 bacterium RIFOXYA2_FULL_46_56]OGC40751.1 MAG: hypothetical protein A2438_00425 [candidate division WOR-1 bacterium RIFOXYC2_FULL_46_14]
MLKRFFLFLLLFLFVSRCEAGLPALQGKLLQLTAPHKGKIGIYFLDMNSTFEAQVYGFNAFPAASTIKLPIMAAAYHLKEQGKINLGKMVVLRQNDKLGGSGVLQWRKPGLSYSLLSLIGYMISFSDNTATKMVEDSVGLASINNYLSSIGMLKTRVTNPTMLSEPPDPNVNMTTPYEMAYLAAKIAKRSGFNDESASDMLYFMHNQRYKWGIWKGVPPGTYVANKTGNLSRILNDVGIVNTKSGAYVLSIFTWGFSSQHNARVLINNVSRVVYEEYTGEKVPEIKEPVKKKVVYKKKKKKKVYRKKIVKRRYR